MAVAPTPMFAQSIVNAPNLSAQHSDMEPIFAQLRPVPQVSSVTRRKMGQQGSTTGSLPANSDFIGSYAFVQSLVVHTRFERRHDKERGMTDGD
jgi:hypothetical protein